MIAINRDSFFGRACNWSAKMEYLLDTINNFADSNTHKKELTATFQQFIIDTDYCLNMMVASAVLQQHSELSKKEVKKRT